MKAEAVQLIDADEAVYILPGHAKLEPTFEPQTKIYAGSVTAKGARVLPSFAALHQEVDRLKSAFLDSTDWLPQALQELKTDPGHGWGQHGAHITLPAKNTLLAATENCPVCRGGARITCHQCQGEQRVVCSQCQGQRQENCFNCFGRGEDPANPQQPCPICHGTRLAPCRFCNATGELACPTCRGSGGTPCADCKGSGKISQEIAAEGQVRLEFNIGRGQDIPSGLLRALDRLEESKLPKGHADVVLIPTDETDPKADKTNLRLEASIPYADIHLRLNGKAVKIGAFGKRGVLFGVPAFLDQSLRPWLQPLEKAARGAETLEKALEARALRDALGLELNGKSAPDDLRRRYPLGLSQATARTIMLQMDQALRRMTLKARVLVAALSFVLSACAFAALFLTPLHQTATESLPLASTALLDFLLPVLALGLSWFSLNHATRWVLQKRYPEASLRLGQKIGKIGAGTMTGIVLAYLALLASAPHKPSWLLWVMGV